MICDTCGIAIRWEPTVIGEHVYCCTGCAEGGPCTCDYDRLPMQGDHVSIVVRWTYEHMERAPQPDAAQPGKPGKKNKQ